ncbi:hypothetical protein CRENBAI_017893 [Crenichthys baileyi]|uniref:G-protein coupled receptors family 1 profile domain-containing protein n=1 Tax=Crenichthys baileyi TaxID=28760 RepID=A0AAV9RDI7_9TELE
MALDRYFAICIPLCYHEHMSLHRFLKFVIPLLIRNVIMILMVVVLAGSLSYCFKNVINHCICEHMALVELACGSTNINSLVGLMTVFLVTVFDFFCITTSYIMIFCSVLRSAFLSYRIRTSLPAAGRLSVSIMYLFLPSCFNPIIYGIRTTEIRQHILRTLSLCWPVQTVNCC